jgi:hypothetical protein
MTNSQDEATPITSVAELIAVGAATADRAPARYRECAIAAAAAGNAEAAAILQRLAAERRACGAGTAAAPSAEPDEMADEDPYTVSAYRVLSIAVRDEMRAFAFYAYAAAHALDSELQRVAEGLAHERLGYAAALRRERREAWRRIPSGSGRPQPPPQSLGELRVLAERLEGGMAVRHRALADAAAALGDSASAEALRSVASEAAGLLPAGAHPPPTANAAVPAATDVLGLLRTALVDLEGAYTMYLHAAEGRAGEGAMLDAQRWAGSAMRRSGAIRGRLTALVRATPR